ncbi:MAG: hypothetical protein WAU86_12980 [Oricola sp.]
MRVFGGAVVWGCMMVASALVSLLLQQDRVLDRHVALILAFYFAGAFLAYVPVRLIVSWANRRLPASLRFLFALIMLAGGTLAGTAFVLALDYRAYYAAWHASAFSRIWFYQQFYTLLGSTFQYLVIGTRLYWPLGVLFLIVASWRLGRKAS